MEDKFRILRNAERFVVNRQYDRAVTEYQKIVETLGEDPSVLNTLGDLLLKTGRREEAVESFRKVAEIFTQSGFVSKAIAIYRKVDQLAPGNREVVRKLAELYARRGMPSESLRYWGKLADLLEEAGDPETLITARRNVVELDQQNPAAHADLGRALGESYPDEASGEWLAAARLHFASESYDSARECAERALELNQANMDARELMVEIDEKLPAEFVEPGEDPGSSASDAPPVPSVNAVESFDEEGESGADASEVPQPSAVSDPVETSEQAAAPHDDTSSADAWTAGLIVPASLESEEPEASEEFDLEAPAEPNDHWGSDDDAAFFGSPAEPAPPPVQDPEKDGDLEAFWVTAAEDKSPSEPETASGSSSDATLSDSGDARSETEAPSAERSLDSSLEEVDFYLKLDLKRDAERLLRDLLSRHPDDERVRARARKINISVSGETLAEQPETAESNLDSALEDLFFDDSLLTNAAEDRLAELESRGEDQRNDPRSQYDLGVAYREMEMFDDAVAKFERAYQLFSDAEDPDQALLCSSMLTSTYLKLHKFDKAVEWSDIGLSLPHVQGIEWKSLEYDRAYALDQIGESEESLNGFRRILERDPDFRDVREQVARMVHEPE